jgi:hypothetical protein
LGSFLKTTEGAQIIWLLFFQVNRDVLVLTKNGLGYILGDFFTDSSGHPGSRVHSNWQYSDKNTCANV